MKKVKEHERKLYLHPKAQIEVLQNGNVLIWLGHQRAVEFTHESFVDLSIIFDSVYVESLIKYSDTWTHEEIDRRLIEADLKPEIIRSNARLFADCVKDIVKQNELTPEERY